MARPKHEGPTPGELAVLRVLWDRGPSTVREVLEILNRKRKRAYTSVMSLMDVMREKGLVSRCPDGRAFRYQPTQDRDATLSGLVKDLLGRAFDGSAALLMAHLLEEAAPSEDEIDQMRKAIAAYRKKEGGKK